MARPALAELNDLEALTGPIAGSDMARAASLLAMASEVVRAYAGKTWLNEAEDAVEDVPGQLPDVVAGMVERATSNPLGVTQESAGPFSRSFGPDASQRLYMTRQERMVVRAAAGRSVVATIGTTRNELETGSVWVGVVGSDEPLPVNTYPW